MNYNFILAGTDGENNEMVLLFDLIIMRNMWWTCIENNIKIL